LRVTLTLFASLREAAGAEEIPLELPDGSTLGDVWPLLAERFPSIAGMGPSLAWAVNHTYAKPSQPLSDGDLVAALPPVSGGTEGHRRG